VWILDLEVVHQQELVVADDVRGERDGVERPLVHEVVAGRIGVRYVALMNARSGSLNFSPALNVLSKTACVSMLRILMRTRCLAAAGRWLRDLDVEEAYGRPRIQSRTSACFDRFHHAGHARYYAPSLSPKLLRGRGPAPAGQSITLASGVPLAL
jgi:hypothetical protein